ncbi:MAG: UDP-N-acetylglucosamine 1-carboxyvinyltransferase, partial [Marinilabiliaceae bacterium]|nr:UDP-N-acetylglucosamine 1-carboxyvinyltransferase [Marinilabiliaceae bacterium]
MSTFKIEGGIPLCGEITPQGAKNEALQIICASLLTSEPVRINNIPNILDINNLLKLLGHLGVDVNRINANTVIITAKDVNLEYMQTEAFKKEASSLRGSIMIMGPLLARYGKAYFPKPGGDKIGRRRLDTHFYGFQKLGARFNFDAGDVFYSVDAPNLKGTYMLLDEASVTGTANILLAATMAKGETTIYNAACEPYVQQLCYLLAGMGAEITGIGSNLLHIKGVTSLHGTEHTILPDMIEVGSFIAMAAMTQGDLWIRGAGVQHLGIIPLAFERMGITIEVHGDDLHIPMQKHYTIDSFIDGSIMTIADAPWPGLTPDLLSVFLVLATQANGSVLIHQKMFESRLFFV